MRTRRVRWEQLEDRRMLADLHQVNYFATWNSNPRIIPSTDPADVGYNPRTGHLFITDSEIDELSEFAGVNIFETSLDGHTLYNSFATNNTEPTGVAFNDFDGFYYVVNDDSKFLTRYSTDFSTKLVERRTTSDVASARDPEGITVDNTTGMLYVADGKDGGMQVLVYNHNLQFQYAFSIDDNDFLPDAEGIAFHPPTGHLFVQGGKRLAEFTTDGEFIQGWNLTNGYSPAFNTPQGAVFAPTSDPTDDPNALALYISDGGRDNFPDGGIYELIVTGLEIDNAPPVVNAGADQSLSAALPASTTLAGSIVDDGLPDPPGNVTRTWSQVSGPGTVTFGNAAALDTSATFSAIGSYVLRLTASDGEFTRADDVQINVNVTSVSRRITVGSDDAEQSSSGSVVINNSDLELGVDGASVQTVGLRFPAMNIPQGAQITNAFIQFKTDEVTTAAALLTIQGQAADNPITFTTQSQNVSNRPRTSASVAWNPAPWGVIEQSAAAQRTPDLKAIVQEIVNRAGWAAGNAMVMIVTGSGVRTAEAFEGDAAGAPMLVVEYATNAPPSINAGADQNVVLQSLGSAVGLTGTVTDDGNPAPVSLTQQWSKVSGPGTVTFGVPTAPSTTAMFSVTGTYVLRLTGNDGALTNFDEVTVTVGLNEAPMVDAGIDRNVTLGSFSSPVSLNGGATDDGHPQPPNLTYHWTVVSGPGTVGFANETSAATTATFSANGAYVLRLTASDDWATGADEVTVTATLNQAPIVSAGPDQLNVVVNSLATVTTLTGTLTDDLLPTAASLAWSLVSGPGSAVFANPNSLTTGVTFTAAGEYVLRLTANDSLAVPVFDDVAVTIAVNSPPTVQLGDDITTVFVDCATPIGLTGSVSDDGLLHAPTLTWTKVSGPGTVSFADPSSASTTATFSVAGDYVLRLEAFDGLATTADEISVILRTNAAPIVDAGADRSILLSTLATDVTITGNVNDDGLPGTPLTTLWTIESGPGTVLFGSDTLQSTTVQFSDAGEYTLRLSANDGILSQSDTVNITVTLGVDSPPIVNAGPDLSEIVNSLHTVFNLVGSASDEGLPYPSTLASLWTVENGPGTVTFGDAASPTTTAQFSAVGTYVLRLTATDGLSPQFDETTVVVTLNLPPAVVVGADQAVIVESLTIPIDISGAATDPILVAGAIAYAWTKFSGPGEVAFGDGAAVATTATFSAPGVYLLRLTATDALGLSGYSDTTVTISLNAPPTVNAGADRTLNGNFPLIAALQGAASDDGVTGAFTTTWSQISGPTLTFTTPDLLNTTAAFPTIGTYVLRLTASDGRVTVTDDVAYTVLATATVLERRVNASSDDAEQQPNGSVDLTSSDLELSTDKTNVQLVGIRFNMIDVPQGATIVNAFIQFTVDENSTAATSLTIRGQAADNAATFTTANSNISNRTLTTSSTPWIPATWPTTNQAGAAQRTPDLSAVIQEIIDRPGWTSGNSMALVIDGIGRRTARAFNGAAASAPLLHIEYTTVPPNAAPGVNAGPDHDLVVESLAIGANLIGAASDDGPTPPTTQWAKTSGPGDVTFGDAAALETSAHFSLPGTYVLRLTANDGVQSSTDEVTIQVRINQAPIVGAGADQNVIVNSLSTPVNLAGTLIDDSLPSPAALLWTQVSGPGTASFGNANSLTTSATFSAAGTYVLRLTASDTLSAPVSAETTVTISLNGAPTVDAGDDQTIDTGLAASLSGTVGDDGIPTASVTSTWSKVSGPGTVDFDDASSLTPTATFSAMGVFVLRLTASDGLAMTTDDVIITLGTDNPPSVNAGSDLSPLLNSLTTAVNLTGTATDEGLPYPSAFTSTWSMFSGPGTVSFGDPSSPATTAVFSAPGTYVLRLSASDGNATSSDEVMVVVALNAAPTVNAGPDQALTGSLPLLTTLVGTANDDGLPGMLTHTWSQLSGPGTATFSNVNALNSDVSFPVAGTYVLKLSASDGSLTTEDTVSIVVSNFAPVTTTFQKRITAGSDDAEQQPNGSVDLKSSDLELVTDGTVVQPAVGLRFTEVTIPKGAIITKAYVQFRVDEVKTAATSLVIRGQAADNPATFANTSNNITSRAQTTSSVVWNPSAWPVTNQEGIDQRTTDVSAILQEVVDRGGWASGNAIVLMFSGTGVRTARSFEGSGAQAPLLYVEYASAPGVNQPPAVSAGPDETVSGTFPRAVTLQGTASDDGLPAASLTHTWSQMSGPGTVTFANPAQLNSSATFPVPGAYVLRLTVTDGQYTATDDVTFVMSATPTGPTVINQRINASSDDAEQQPNGSVDLTSSDLELTTDGTAVQVVGLRFNALQIPQGSTITSAYVQFTTDEITVLPTSLVIRGQAADNAATFANTNSNISSRPTTSASAAWSPSFWITTNQAGADQRTTNLASIIQEIVDRSGWAAGNSLVLVITGSGARTAKSFNGSSTAAPLLHIEFTRPSSSQDFVTQFFMPLVESNTAEPMPSSISQTIATGLPSYLVGPTKALSLEVATPEKSPTPTVTNTDGIAERTVDEVFGRLGREELEWSNDAI